MSEQEIEWRPVKDFPNYEVSNTGLVRNIKKGGKLIRPNKNKGGYARIDLYHKGTSLRVSVHRVVALAFIPRIGGKNNVNHIDGNTLNNHVSNLEWVTQKENGIHASQVLNKVAYGEAAKSAKLKLAQVIEIKQKWDSGAIDSDLATEYNVCRDTIRRIISGKTWSRALNEQI